MFNFLSKDPMKKISAKEAKERMESDKGVVLLDVREEREYFDKHIPKSINLPLGKISTVEKVIPDEETTVFVYCLSGGRSSQAVGQMNKMGYKNVYNLGGIGSWHYETVSGK